MTTYQEWQRNMEQVRSRITPRYWRFWRRLPFNRGWLKGYEAGRDAGTTDAFIAAGCGLRPSNEVQQAAQRARIEHSIRGYGSGNAD
jgi:hypothetical protein